MEEDSGIWWHQGFFLAKVRRLHGDYRSKTCKEVFALGLHFYSRRVGDEVGKCQIPFSERRIYD